MTRSLLVCGNSDILTPPLVSRASAADFRVVVARPTGPDNDGRPAVAPTAPAPAVVTWNRRSPLSARTLLAQAENAVPRLTDIVYVHQCGGHPGRVPTFHEMPAADVEQTVDNETKGRLFLLKEAIAHLQRNGGGSLTLVLYGSVDAETQPLDAEIAGGFLALGRSLFTWYRNEPVVLRGYQAGEPLAEEFCRVLVEELAAGGGRAVGKWHRFAARPGLFTFGR